ncbi:hypothetical protein, partial [Morganella morganii]|uniref:hypothetical protein n=1 Tax=Morganella morganii TaxID=582 RepID=UPI001C7128CF
AGTGFTAGISVCCGLGENNIRLVVGTGSGDNSPILMPGVPPGILLFSPFPGPGCFRQNAA